MKELNYELRKEICSNFFEIAKEIMKKDGNQSMIIFVMNDKFETFIFPNSGNLEKYEYTKMASLLAKKIGAIAVICVSEIYLSELQTNDKRIEDPNFKPSEDPNHKEALAVMLTDPYGDACLKIGYFEKIEDKIVFGEKEEWIEHGTMNMIPPWEKATIH